MTKDYIFHVKVTADIDSDDQPEFIEAMKDELDACAAGVTDLISDVDVLYVQPEN